jgi:hypothetical protein
LVLLVLRCLIRIWGRSFSELFHHFLVHFVDEIDTDSLSEVNQEGCVKWDLITVRR